MTVKLPLCAMCGESLETGARLIGASLADPCPTFGWHLGGELSCSAQDHELFRAYLDRTRPVSEISAIISARGAGRVVRKAVTKTAEGS